MNESIKVNFNKKTYEDIRHDKRSLNQFMVGQALKFLGLFGFLGFFMHSGFATKLFEFEKDNYIIGIVLFFTIAIISALPVYGDGKLFEKPKYVGNFAGALIVFSIFGDSITKKLFSIEEYSFLESMILDTFYHFCVLLMIFMIWQGRWYAIAAAVFALSIYGLWNRPMPIDLKYTYLSAVCGLLLLPAGIWMVLRAKRQLQRQAADQNER